MDKNCSLWVEKWRPDHVKDLVMPKAFHQYFNKIVESGNIPNLLLYSSTPGTGKTTIAKAIVNDLNADCLYINASSDGRIDTLRTSIQEFAQTKSFNKKMKIVILDEFDGTTPQFQGALRAFIEEYSKSCRFILTANYIAKVIPALQEGRTATFDFNMNQAEFRKEINEGMFKRLSGILKYEKVEFDETALRTLIDAYSPSMRKLLSTLQKYYESYGRIDADIAGFRSIGNDLSALIKNHKYTEARAYCISNGFAPQDIYKNLFDNLIPTIEDKAKRGQAIVLLAEYEYRSAMSSMPDLQVAACFFELMSLV